MDAIDHGCTPALEWFQAVGREDGLFPGLNAADWATLPQSSG
jgi:1,4-alpha-glucan branching enzyme